MLYLGFHVCPDELAAILPVLGLVAVYGKQGWAFVCRLPRMVFGRSLTGDVK